jgi:hypothetical protein
MKKSGEAHFVTEFNFSITSLDSVQLIVDDAGFQWPRYVIEVTSGAIRKVDRG